MGVGGAEGRGPLIEGGARLLTGGLKDDLPVAAEVDPEPLEGDGAAVVLGDDVADGAGGEGVGVHGGGG